MEIEYTQNPLTSKVIVDEVGILKLRYAILKEEIEDLLFFAQIQRQRI